MALKQAEIQAKVKAEGFKTIQSENAVQFGDYSLAVPVEIEGVEYWAKISVVCGQIKDTKTSPAFDPFVAREEWELDKEFKEKERLAKEKAKADKITRSKKKSD